MSESESRRTRAFYDAVAAKYAELLPDTSYEAPLDLAVRDHFVAMLPESGAAVLDAGCGAGRMLDYLREHNVDRLSGVDLSPAMIALARAAHPDLPLDVADISALPHSSGTFDGVLSWYSIIHTAPGECGAIVAEFARVMAPNAVVLLAFQAGIGERTVDNAYGQNVTLHAYLHSTAHLAELLVLHGFDIEASVDRGPRAHERHAQGFIVARRR